MDHFNQLSPAEAERLALLIEECGEVIQAATKVLRHGWESVNPILRAKEQFTPTNRSALAKELGQLMFAADLITAHDLSASVVVAATAHKRDTIRQWLHHNQENVP